MKKGEFSKKKGTLKIDYERPYQTPDEVSAVLKCVLSQNHKKGSTSITFTLNHQQISTNIEVNKATLKSATDLMLEAIEDANAWKMSWSKENQEPEDKNQLGLGLGEEE